MMKKVAYILVCLLMLAACRKEPAELVPEHALTAQEQHKQELDQMVTRLVEASGVSERNDFLPWLLRNAHLDLTPSGTLTLTLQAKGSNLFSLTLEPVLNGLTLRHYQVKGYCLGDYRLAGSIERIDVSSVGGSLAQDLLEDLLRDRTLSGIDWEDDDTALAVIAALDDAVDVKLYHDSVLLASLGVEPYLLEGDDSSRILPILVFRFDDGTSYALSSLLLVDPLLSLFFQNDAEE